MQLDFNWCHLVCRVWVLLEEVFAAQSGLCNLWVMANSCVVTIALCIMALLHVPHEVLRVFVFLFANGNKSVVVIVIVVERIVGCQRRRLEVIRGHEISQRCR